ncbi:hypothetical protein Bca4012_019577 [Brassica carinata]
MRKTLFILTSKRQESRKYQPTLSLKLFGFSVTFFSSELALPSRKSILLPFFSDPLSVFPLFIVTHVSLSTHQKNKKESDKVDWIFDEMGHQITKGCNGTPNHQRLQYYQVLDSEPYIIDGAGTEPDHVIRTTVRGWIIMENVCKKYGLSKQSTFMCSSLM